LIFSRPMSSRLLFIMAWSLSSTVVTALPP
jgi:hypothetical protein